MQFHCSGFRQGFPYSYLTAFWFGDLRDRPKALVQFHAAYPEVARQNRSIAGWSIRAEWDTSIGSYGSWQQSFWGAGRFSAGAPRKGSWVGPESGARPVRGENEWRLPLRGSREAIDAALAICRKAPP